MVSSLEPHHPHPNLLPPKPGFRGLLRISVSIPDECALNSLFNEVNCGHFLILSLL